ncbi:MAG: hypothetical protein U0075_04605 [Thermomicrobiales bacterium]
MIGSVIDADLLLAVAGPVADEVDACIARGLLLGKGEHLAFRHELAREAILSALAPTRRRLLHARVLSALRELPETSRDLARMAHHAEAAGDRQAVLAYAVAAAEQASAFFSHREAAAQYARALRFGDALPPAERAALLEARSVACYLGDQGEEAIAARRMALEIWQRLGDARREGSACAGCRTWRGAGARLLLRHRRRWKSWSRCRRVLNWRWPTATWPNCTCSITISRERCSGERGQLAWQRNWARRKRSSTR